MPRVRVRIVGMPKAAAKVARVSAAIDRAEILALQDVALVVLGGAKRRLRSPLSGIKKGTGRLSRGLFMKVEKDYKPRHARVGVHASVPYARIQEQGGRTRPHIIRPRVKKALAWPTGRAAGIYKFSRFHGRTAKQSQARARKAAPGEFAFARMVRHPGSVIRGQFFLRRSLDEEGRPAAPVLFRKRLSAATGRA